MTARRSPLAGVFGPYEPEASLVGRSPDVDFCGRCREQGRKTALQHKPNAVGIVISRCPVCDGVAPARPVLPNEVFRPQALVGAAQLLPPCPAGALRCQHCAKPVADNDDRFCLECQNPGLSKKEIAAMHRAREDREAAAAPPRPRAELPRPLYPFGAKLKTTYDEKIEPTRAPAKPEALARAVARQERGPKRAAATTPAPAKVRTCLTCGRQSPHTGGPREIKDCSICTPKGTRAARVYQAKVCACGCGQTFQPSGPRSLYIEGHHR